MIVMDRARTRSPNIYSSSPSILRSLSTSALVVAAFLLATFHNPAHSPHNNERCCPSSNPKVSRSRRTPQGS